ncbi:hypothetical protein [Curtobacterium sp. MCBD17_021]|uniref:hypothetical protein n=1 Tax=Curtobacterium sp. MCBD17_021 TaxID=2175665 RepID=UPI0015E8DA58|nr:hypothetical protein [Curtobacterium sp. MCBD17_021]
MTGTLSRIGLLIGAVTAVTLATLCIWTGDPRWAAMIFVAILAATGFIIASFTEVPRKEPNDDRPRPGADAPARS